MFHCFCLLHLSTIVFTVNCFCTRSTSQAYASNKIGIILIHLYVKKRELLYNKIFVNSGYLTLAYLKVHVSTCLYVPQLDIYYYTLQTVVKEDIVYWLKYTVLKKSVYSFYSFVNGIDKYLLPFF